MQVGPDTGDGLAILAKQLFSEIVTELDQKTYWNRHNLKQPYITTPYIKMP